MATPFKHTSLSPAGAISLALSLGLVCTLAGIMMTGYVTDNLDGSKWFQFAWLSILTFLVPGGFVVLSEFTPRAFRTLAIMQWIKRVFPLAFWGLNAVLVFSVPLNLDWFPSVAKFLFPLPGLTLITLAMLEKHALKSMGGK